MGICLAISSHSHGPCRKLLFFVDEIRDTISRMQNVQRRRREDPPCRMCRGMGEIHRAEGKNGMSHPPLLEDCQMGRMLQCDAMRCNGWGGGAIRVESRAEGSLMRGRSPLLVVRGGLGGGGGKLLRATEAWGRGRRSLVERG